MDREGEDKLLIIQILAENAEPFELGLPRAAMGNMNSPACLETKQMFQIKPLEG